MAEEEEETINERLKFLIEKYGMSVRAFSSAIGATDTNTRNYIDRGSKPNAEYLGKLLKRFNDINPTWLLLGEGEPFLNTSPNSAVNHSGDFNVVGTANTQKIKVTKAPAQELAQQLDACQRDNESLKQQLARADALVAAKDETITLLRASYNRPN